jgi:hypothetical protein
VAELSDEVRHPQYRVTGLLGKGQASAALSICGTAVSYFPSAEAEGRSAQDAQEEVKRFCGGNRGTRKVQLLGPSNNPNDNGAGYQTSECGLLHLEFPDLD